MTACMTTVQCTSCSSEYSHAPFPEPRRCSRATCGVPRPPSCGGAAPSRPSERPAAHTPTSHERAPRRAPYSASTEGTHAESPDLPHGRTPRRYMDGGSLADVLHAAQLTGSGPLSEMVLGKLAARTLAGLNYLHRERHQVRSSATRTGPRGHPIRRASGIGHGPSLPTTPLPRHAWTPQHASERSDKPAPTRPPPANLPVPRVVRRSIAILSRATSCSTLVARCARALVPPPLFVY